MVEEFIAPENLSPHGVIAPIIVFGTREDTTCTLHDRRVVFGSCIFLLAACVDLVHQHVYA